MLLAGDLFHENRPSSKSMKRCVELLRKYCLGKNRIEFAIVSDQSVNFQHSAFKMVNYQDKNLNISLPVFSIHGNHDDPIGKDPLGALDTLNAVGLINYFGKYVNMEYINVEPLLLKKNEHKVALYGIGSLPEERLHRLFLHEKISFSEPDDPETWFKIFVVHQNRVAHGTKYLPESLLGDLPDFVIWGHEHEAKPNLDLNTERAFYVYQPGSTVATSLCPAEAKRKQVGLLNIYWDSNDNRHRFKLDNIPLKTVRRLIFEEMSLLNVIPANAEPDKVNDLVFETVAARIDDLIDRATVDHSNDPREPELPLIRVRVECASEYHHLNPSVFNHRFKDKVANPKDLVLFRKKRNRPADTSNDNIDVDDMDDIFEIDNTGRCNIQDVIVEYFANADEKTKLTLLSEKLMVQAIREVVEKDQSTDKVTQAIDFQRKSIHDLLVDMDVPLEDKSLVKQAIKECKEKLLQDEAKVAKDLNKLLRNSTRGSINSDSFSQSLSQSLSQESNGQSPLHIVDSSSDSDINIVASYKKSPVKGSRIF